MLQIVASLTDDSGGVINDCNMFIVQATGPRTLTQAEYTIEADVAEHVWVFMEAEFLNSFPSRQRPRQAWFCLARSKAWSQKNSSF